MALPNDLEARYVRLTNFKEAINKLADYLSKNHSEHMEKDVDPVDAAISIMEFMKG